MLHTYLYEPLELCSETHLSGYRFRISMNKASIVTTNPDRHEGKWRVKIY